MEEDEEERALRTVNRRSRRGARAIAYPPPDMVEMNDARWRYTADYLVEVFGREDEALAGLAERAQTAGLPEIAISADVGRLLALLTSMTRGRLAIEVGTLGGYSAIWLARGLRDGGRLVTIEPDPKHAAFAREELARAGLSERVEVREGTGLEVLPALTGELSPGSVDVLFLDAIKAEYPAYFDAAEGLIAPGGLVIADNALGSSQWWIDHEDDPQRAGADALNRRLAAHPDYEAVALPIREGVLVARRSAEPGQPA